MIRLNMHREVAAVTTLARREGLMVDEKQHGGIMNRSFQFVDVRSFGRGAKTHEKSFQLREIAVGKLRGSCVS
jgi:hypothetical protein